MTGKYVLGSISSLLGGSSQIADDEPTKASSLFEPKPIRKRTIGRKRQEHIEDVSDKKNPNNKKEEGSPKKKKKQKSECKLLVSRESVFDEGVSTSNKKKIKDKEKKLRKMISKEIDPDKDERTIFVGNLLSNIDKKGLIKMFRRFGKIDTARIRSAVAADMKLPRKVAVITKDFHPVKNTVNGYVVFKTSDSAKKAQIMNGKVVDGLHVRVDLASGGNKFDHNRSIFIGNVPFAAQEESIRGYFSQFGSIENVRIIRDNRTGLGKGFGYIQYQEKSSVGLATLSKCEHSFDGRSIRVMHCQAGTTGKKETPVKKNKSQGKVKRKDSNRVTKDTKSEMHKSDSPRISMKVSKKKQIKQKISKKKKDKLGTFLIGSKNKSADVKLKVSKNKRKKERRANESKKKDSEKSSFGNRSNVSYARIRLAKKSKS